MPAPKPPQYNLPEGVSDIHVKDYDAVVTLKDGTKERYNLRVTADKDRYENKYSIQKQIPQISKVHSATSIAETMETKIVSASVGEPRMVTVETPATVSGTAKEAYIYSQGLSDEKLGSELEILAVITNKTTFKELEQLKAVLKEKGITLTWINMKTDDGNLVMLEGKLQKETDKCEFRISDFKKLVISRGPNNLGKTGFHIRATADENQDQ